MIVVDKDLGWVPSLRKIAALIDDARGRRLIVFVHKSGHVWPLALLEVPQGSRESWACMAFSLIGSTAGFT
jgi:hypothetical protein